MGQYQADLPVAAALAGLRAGLASTGHSGAACRLNTNQVGRLFHLRYTLGGVS
jgi:hypothetical protein